VPRELAERMYLAGEHVPAAFGLGDTELELASREAK
jgi:pilus assembly protein CpaF